MQTTSAQGTAQVVNSIVPPPTAVLPESTVSIDWVSLNPTAGEVRFTTPLLLRGNVFVGESSWPIELTSTVAAPVTISPGGFTVRPFTFVLPAGVKGRVILSVQREPGESPVQAVLMVSGDAVRPSATEPAPLTNFAVKKPAASAIERSFAGRLGAHEPIYFIYGAEEPAAKFQFSFKYRILNFGQEAVPQTLQFAYTQRSLWDIEADSSPFFDTSYMPELVFESLAPMPEQTDAWFTWLGYQAAYKHESNGRDGSLSRSLNTLNLRGAFSIGGLESWQLLVIPEVFGYIGDLENNPDIENYRGYGQLRMVFGRNDGPTLMFTGIAGKDFDHRTYQLDFTVPFRTRFLEFEAYFLIQYFNGFGESLRTYREKSEALRAGFSLVR
ncbi:MAG TPA: phospholipase A [Opitutaceae bacterium]|nr:phospholipase A [Opitutaceae bacterium]